MSGEMELDWLKKNKPLRMDANVDWFDAGRREFHLQRYRFASQRVAGKDVADIACGTGYGTAMLAEHAATVVGVDFASEAVAYAQKTYPRENVRFQVGFAERTGLASASVDAVVSFETIEHLIAPEMGIREYCRLLRSDGILVASVPNNWGFTSHHFLDFNYHLLKSLVDRCFASATYHYQNSGRLPRFRPEGTGVLTPELQETCECILVVASGPRPGAVDDDDGISTLLAAIYASAFERHRAFLALQKKGQKLRRLKARMTSLLGR